MYVSILRNSHILRLAPWLSWWKHRSHESSVFWTILYLNSQIKWQRFLQPFVSWHYWIVGLVVLYIQSYIGSRIQTRHTFWNITFTTYYGRWPTLHYVHLYNIWWSQVTYLRQTTYISHRCYIWWIYLFPVFGYVTHLPNLTYIPLQDVIFGEPQDVIFGGKPWLVDFSAQQTFRRTSVPTFRDLLDKDSTVETYQKSYSQMLPVPYYVVSHNVN